MRVLVTGGAGFIGSNYVRAVLAGRFAGWERATVVVVDNLGYAATPANLPLEHPRLTFVEADVCDPEPLMTLVRGCDAVVHFAAESHVDRSLRGARRFVLSNVLGTQNLLECCRRAGVPRIVHVSTDEVYGSIADGSWDEEEPLLPNSPYAASKAAADLVARAYHRSHGVPVVVTRCSNNYGPYQHPEKVIPLFVTNLLSGRDVPLYGDGLHRREWLHVSDHCDGVHLALEKGGPGEIYNLGGGTELTNRDLTGRLLELCGAGWDRVRPVADRPAHDRRYAVDIGKARRELGFEPRVGFDEGLAGVVRWYRENRAWWDRGALPAVSAPRSRPAVARIGRRPVVVGACGFIGSRLLDRLHEQGREAGAIDRRTPLVSARGPHPDLRDAEVVHYLATSVNPAIAEDRPDLVAADQDTFERFLDALADLPRPPLVVLTGSGGAVYDPSLPPPYDERTPARPRSAYGRAKLALETALRERAPAVPGLVLRLGNVYGPGQRTGTGQGVIAHWLEAIAGRRPVRVYGDAEVRRDYVFVDDVVDVLASIRRGDTSAPVLNIGSGEGVPLGELLRVVASVVGERPAAETHTPRAFDARDVTLDIRLAAAELGWRPRTPLAEGIALTWRDKLAQAGAGAGRGHG